MSEGKWIYNRKWDLVFISFSVLMVPIPYLTWLLMRDVLQLQSETGRQAVNLLIAAMIGGPHMYATFTRTALDADFRERYSGFVRSSIIIPLIVITLALTNLTLLLTMFFFCLWWKRTIRSQVRQRSRVLCHPGRASSITRWF